MLPRFARALLFAIPAAVFAPSAYAELRDENLMLIIPDGYKIAHRDHNSKSLITEMIPAGESVEDWSEMVTVQIFRELADDAPADFRAHMATQWSVACSGSSLSDAAEVTVNGYPSASWTLTCPLNPQSGKPEVTMFKAIQGNDSFYLVQKAFKWVPRQDEKKAWDDYLGKVVVCDTRVPDRACPAAN